MNNDNITFCIEENEEKLQFTENNDANFLLESESENNGCQDEMMSKMVNYNLNYLTKDLLVICDYYGIGKILKTAKANKEQIIEALVFFENSPENQEIVSKRNLLWFYMNELKNDRFMRKFIVLWH
jgi:hypothetical protein